MRTPLRLAFGLLLLLAPAAAARAEDPPPAPPAPVKVLEHDLTVRFLPAEHRLVAEDRLLVEAGGSGGRLDLAVAPTLEPLGPVRDGEGRALEGAAGATQPGHATVWRAIPVPAGRSTLVVRYGGVLFDAVEKAGDLTWVAGDGTRGLVSEKGIYLAGSSRWVPTPPDAGLARFHVKAYVPEPFLVVTQGTLPERTTVTSPGAPGAGANPVPDALPAVHDGPTTTWNVLAARAALPTDSLSLVAGPYETQSRTVEGVTIATWFQKAEAPDAGLWLDSMDEVVRRYARILGPYPHPKLDIVENFFQTGYGMPGFTLLGDAVIQYVTQGAKRTGRIPPGYLDHEYVHGWYGNGLFVDYATGNWCEALTTYCSNYLAKELESVGEARAHRRGVLEKWSLRVKGAKDTPVRAFQEKTEDTDNDIGYGKGSLLFHVARRLMGDEAFWGTLRRFTQARVGTVVSWDDFLKAFDEASGISVTAHVKPFLDRPGLPAVTITVSEPKRAPTGWLVSVHGTQTPGAPGAEPFPLFVPVRLEGEGGESAEAELDLSSGTGVVGFLVGFAVRAVALDPDYHALRRIDERDLPPCLERTLLAGAGGAGVVVLAGGGAATLKPLAEQIAATKGLRVVGPDFDLAAFAGPALVLGVAPKGAPALSIGGSTYDDPAVAVLHSSAEGGRLRTTYTALSEEAAARAGRLPFYAWDPWVVFRAGRPIARDPRNQERPSTRVVLDAGPSEAAKRIQADIATLCSPEFEGRWPGTAGHDKARSFLREALQAWSPGGATTLRLVLPPLSTTSPREIVLHHPDGRREVLPVGARRLAGTTGTLTGATPAGFGVLRWDRVDWPAFCAHLESKGNALFFCALGPDARRAWAPLLDGLDGLTPESEAELAKPGRDGKPRPRPPLAPWILGRRARLGVDAEALRRVVFVVDEEAAARLEAAYTADALVSLKAETGEPVRGDSVLGGSVEVELRPLRPGAERAKRPVIVLSAHYDSFGRQGEALWVGADDNASGVACALEVMRLLPADAVSPTSGGPGVVILFPDAEEWGLQGSRAAVRELQARFDVRAVINVDSIGRAVSKPTHVLGLSQHPALARLVRNALEADGLVVGPDIDAYGYEEGSDHWPFHQAGIPAVTLWASDYGVMNTGDDTPEKVEPEGVARIAVALARLLRERLADLAALPPAPPAPATGAPPAPPAPPGPPAPGPGAPR